MAIFTEKEYETMENVIDGMIFKPFAHGDRFYPTEEDIDRLGTMSESGREYSKDEVRYMHWLIQFPSRESYPESALPTRKKILGILGGLDLVSISEEAAAREREEMKKLLNEIKGAS